MRDARSPAATSPAIFATRAKARRSSRTRTCSIRLSHVAEGQPSPPADALPTDTYFTDYYKLSHFFNGEGVQLLHMPKANTDGDSIVYFRGSDVIALGDLMSTESYPVFDVAKGGSINGIIDGLNAVLDLAITEFRLEGGTMMVPGHGRIVDSGDVAYYRDMLTIIRDRIQDMVKKEMTLDEVKAAKPTADYDTEYGNDAGLDDGHVHRSGLQESRRWADASATRASAGTQGRSAMNRLRAQAGSWLDAAGSCGARWSCHRVSDGSSRACAARPR